MFVYLADSSSKTSLIQNSYLYFLYIVTDLNTEKLQKNADVQKNLKFLEFGFVKAEQALNAVID